MEAVEGDVDGLYADASFVAQGLWASAHAVVSAEEIANDVVFPRDVPNVGVHVLHFELKAIERFCVRQGKRDDRFVVRKESETTADEVVMEIIHAKNASAHFEQERRIVLLVFE